jgi:hypothetical protein
MENNNREAFEFYAALLREQGFRVFNPLEKESQTEAEPNDEKFLRKMFFDDCKFICLESDVVALMPGWKRSRGCRAEKALAQAIGIPILFLEHREGGVQKSE